MSNLFGAIGSARKLEKDNEDLNLRAQELLSENTFLKELKKENEILKGALGIGLEKEFQLVLASVLGKDISQDSIMIDKGKKDGLIPDLPVITGQKILIGKVSDIYDNFSRVMLISHKEISFDAKVSEKEVQGIIKGQGNSKILFDLVPQEKELKEGDLVITTALGGIFPERLLAGKVVKIRKSDVSPFQQAEIYPAFEIQNLEKIFIINFKKQ